MRIAVIDPLTKLDLLPQDRLIQTSRVDHADWNYRPLLAYVMRRRFALIRSLMHGKRANRLLEIGFGSGIFMPDLSHRCRELYGIDVHERVPEVQTQLEACGIHTVLSKQDAAQMDFADGFFDVIVSVSALEFIERIDESAHELSRVLAPGGRLIAVIPQKSAVLDLLLHVTTGEDAERDYGGRRERVLPALLRYFRVFATAAFPPIYSAYELGHVQ